MKVLILIQHILTEFSAFVILMVIMEFNTEMSDPKLFNGSVHLNNDNNNNNNKEEQAILES